MSTVADLLQNRVLTVRSDRPQAEEGPVPPEWLDRVAEARRRVTELVAEQVEVLLEHYVNNGGLTDDMLVQGLRIGVCRRTWVPVVGGSALHHSGIHSLLHGVIQANWLPAPEGEIYLVMRLYWPKETPPSSLPAGEGTWQPPALVMTK